MDGYSHLNGYREVANEESLQLPPLGMPNSGNVAACDPLMLAGSELFLGAFVFCAASCKRRFDLDNCYMEFLDRNGPAQIARSVLHLRTIHHTLMASDLSGIAAITLIS